MNRRNFLHASGATLLGGLVGSRIASGATLAANAATAATKARLTVFFNRPRRPISRMLYGQFTEHLGRCIYDGIWVGPDSSIPNTNGLRNASIDLLKKIQTPLVRWPGGCFADTYHWRDGIGPRDQRPSMRNIWWDRDESNAYGTDEFLEFCHLTGASPYICLNVGSGSPEEAMGWMEYCNGHDDTTITNLRKKYGHPDPYGVRFWSVGNESWGCGGNFEPESYADEFTRFMTFLGRAAGDRGDKDRFVACGNSYGDWNQRMFERLFQKSPRTVDSIHYLSIHYYSDTAWDGTDFTDDDYYSMLGTAPGINRAITRTADILDYYSTPEHKVVIGLDEWGAWHHGHPRNPGSDKLRQHNTFADAILAAVILNMMNNRSDVVQMSTLAQTFNVLQCVAITDGPKFTVTPTAWVFDMYRPHQNSDGLDVIVDSPEFEAKERGFMGRTATHQVPKVNASASISKSGDSLCITLVNQDLQEDLPIEIDLAGMDNAFGSRTGTLRMMDSAVRGENTFSDPHAVPVPSSRPFHVSGSRFTLELPAHSIQTLTVPLKA